MKVWFDGEWRIYFEGKGKKVIVDGFMCGKDKCEVDAERLEVD